MTTWTYENGSLVAKDAEGRVIFERQMSEAQARIMAHMVNLDDEEGKRRTLAQVPGKAPDTR